MASCVGVGVSAPRRPVQLGVGGEHVEVVEEFEYLGSTNSQDCSLDHKVA